MLLLIVNGCTVILETVILHGSVYIALGGFFCFLQSVVVQFIIEAILKVVVSGNQIATLRLCRFGADFVLIFYNRRISGITLFIFLMVELYLFFACISQIVKIQIFQFTMNQLFQRLILSGLKENVMQITLDTKIHQICVCLNANFFICDRRMTNTNRRKVTKVSVASELSLTIIVNQFLRQLQLCIDFFFCGFDCLSLGFFFGSEIATFLHQRINSLRHLCPGHLHIVTAALVITDTLGIVILTAMGCTGTGMGMTTCAKFLF